MPGETPSAYDFSHKGKWEQSDYPDWWDIAPKASCYLTLFRAVKGLASLHSLGGVGGGQKGWGHSNHCADLKSWTQILLTGSETSPRGLPPNSMGHLTGSSPSGRHVPPALHLGTPKMMLRSLLRQHLGAYRQHTDISSWLDLAGSGGGVQPWILQGTDLEK